MRSTVYTWTSTDYTDLEVDEVYDETCLILTFTKSCFPLKALKHFPRRRTGTRGKDDTQLVSCCHGDGADDIS